MDHSKVSKAVLPTQAQSTTAPTRQADPASKSRFLRAFEQGPATKERSPQNSGVPLYTLLANAGSQARPDAPMPTHTPPKAEANAELTALLERACSAMYVGDKSASGQRVVLSLDPVLAGATAEIVRDGAHLRIKLFARTDAAYQSMSAQRYTLVRSLGFDWDRSLDIEVVDPNRPRGGTPVAATR